MAQSESAQAPQLLPPRRSRGRRSSLFSWRARDQAVFALAWITGIGLCLVVAAIVLLFATKGFDYLRPDLLFSRPSAAVNQAQSGGFLDPIEGTVMLGILGLAIAAPLGVITAVWVVEYGRPRWLSRIVESAVEVIAGTPDVVLAIFGLALFELGIFAPLSFSSPGGAFGRSFLTSGIIVSAVAIPSVYTATRNGLIATPRQLREASYALGKTRIATIRRVVLPAVRRDIATGATLGLGRIIGDTAIVILLLGATLRTQTESGTPLLGLLRGTGSTLTSYIYNNSPSGEGNAPNKAYAAAAFLLLLILLLNWGVGRIGRIGGPPIHEERRLGA
ncbi:MAG TPA: ABC transporter permease subunit [Solirubrobacteraceae bacterium]|jgi:phosphate transport system permease protein|nr:ABC transporter permease subunit [Solirubrobacteraceae bacterium]